MLLPTVDTAKKSSCLILRRTNVAAANFQSTRSVCWNSYYLILATAGKSFNILLTLERIANITEVNSTGDICKSEQDLQAP